jgi:GMP synthase-like glutamine amidotransferase
MHLAILMTNTDESDFAQMHPKDGEKFSQMIALVRPQWRCTTFSVKDGHFPDDLFSYDGAMITGSPASVRDDAEWITKLFDLIRDAHAQKFPLFGACFGHQAICVALGGTIARNKMGWGHGILRNWGVSPLPWRDCMSEFYLYGSHIEQITIPPIGATVVSASESCDIAGITVGDHIFTTQHHPEMTHDFIVALVDELADYVGPNVTQAAQKALSANQVDMRLYADEIAQFFEHTKS